MNKLLGQKYKGKGNVKCKIGRGVKMRFIRHKETMERRILKGKREKHPLYQEKKRLTKKNEK